MRYLTKPQLDQYLEYLKTHRQDEWCLTIELLARAGCRTHEIAILQYSAIDLVHGTLSIVAVKGSDNHTVPIDKGCLTAMAQSLHHYQTILAMFAQNSIDSFKRRLRDQHDRHMLKCFGMDGPKCGLHGLRASFAMTMYTGLDFDILLVKQLLGHRSLNSTMKYVHAVNLESRKNDILRAITPSRARPYLKKGNLQ